MKARKPLLICLFFVLTSISLTQAQTKFEIPQNVQLNTKEDYKKYETSIIDAAKWLEETDLNKEADKRQQVNAFVLQWVSGSPTVTVMIDEQLGKIYGKNTQLLGLYLASYSRNFLENQSSATKFLATKAALMSIMTVYKKGIEIKKNKAMDKLIKQTEDGKLDDYVNDRIK